MEEEDEGSETGSLWGEGKQRKGGHKMIPLTYYDIVISKSQDA